MSDIQILLEAMWKDYLELNPNARKIHQLFSDRNNDKPVINDHIALRTFNLNKVGIENIAQPFVRAGYAEGGEYHFSEKKLYAKHYQHQDPTLPKVFISELLVEQLSDYAQQVTHELVDQIDEGVVNSSRFCYSGRPWEIDYATYQRLLSESEYAAWMAAFGYRPNHFTVLVNALELFPDLESVNRLLIDHGFIMNESGGLIKGSPDVLLEQSSTMATKINVRFSDKEIEIPSCYYEFARRYALSGGELYQGFVAASADKIFESTDVN